MLHFSYVSVMDDDIEFLPTQYFKVKIFVTFSYMVAKLQDHSMYLINLLYHRTLFRYQHTSYRIIEIITVTAGFVKSQFKIYLNSLQFFAGMYFPVIDSQYQREEDKNHVLAYNKWMYFQGMSREWMLLLKINEESLFDQHIDKNHPIYFLPSS